VRFAHCRLRRRAERRGRRRSLPARAAVAVAKIATEQELRTQEWELRMEWPHQGMHPARRCA
jgi:hypothetical protein